MARLSRRGFLATLAGAGPGAIVLSSLPPWAREALAASEPGIIVRNDWPEHWETSLSALGRSWLTPNDVFFVRSHFTPPDVDVASGRHRALAGSADASAARTCGRQARGAPRLARGGGRSTAAPGTPFRAQHPDREGDGGRAPRTRHERRSAATATR